MIPPFSVLILTGFLHPTGAGYKGAGPYLHESALTWCRGSGMLIEETQNLGIGVDLLRLAFGQPRLAAAGPATSSPLDRHQAQNDLAVLSVVDDGDRGAVILPIEHMRAFADLTPRGEECLNDRGDRGKVGAGQTVFTLPSR
jgi:hypothetical protein